MRYLFIALCVLFISSCRCPEIIQGTTERTDSTSAHFHSQDTTTSHKIDTNTTAPIIFSGTVNIDSVCEELRRIRIAGQDSAKVEVKQVNKTTTKKSSVSVNLSSSGIATIDCKTDSLTKITDSLMMVINIKDSVISTKSHYKETNNKELVPVKDWWYKTWRGIAIFYLVLTVIFILAKWAGSYTKPFG